MTKVCITAGFDRALNAIAIAELLKRESIDIAALYVVSPFSPARLRAYIRQQGAGFVLKSAKRLIGTQVATDDAVHDLLKAHRITVKSLKEWASANGVAYKSVKSLNHEETIHSLRGIAPEWVVYAGGGILRSELIDAVDGRILNAHAGPLPEVRGMNACEWSLLLNYKPHVTVHMINRGIDTGGIIQRYPIDLAHDDTIDSIRAKAASIGILGLVETVLDKDVNAQTPSDILSRQCFVLAPALKELLKQRLEKNAYCVAR